MVRSEIRHLEEAADRAWPAAEVERGDDWEARFAHGMHRRINSATIWAAADLAATVGRLEKWYRERERSPIFKLTAASAPGLDELLESRGYVPDARVSIMTAPVGDAASEPAVEIAPDPSPEWIDSFCTISDYGERNRALLPGILDRIPGPTGYAARREAGTIVAVGLAVAERPLAGLFEMATDPDHRRRGLAGEVRDALLAWMKEQGCSTAYLQVLRGNRPAERLYRHAGFSPVYEYWYRVRPDGLSAAPR